MLLTEIITLYTNDQIITLPDLDSNTDISRFVRIYYKNNDSNYENLGGHLQVPRKQIKNIYKNLSQKNYMCRQKNITCYCYDNKKLYVENNNRNSTSYKEEIIYDFQYADNYLMIVLDEKKIKSTQFPIVNNYHEITNYLERTYIINNDISVIFKEFDVSNIHLLIQIRITDKIIDHLERSVNNYNFKQINNLLNEVLRTGTNNKVQQEPDRK